MFGKLRTIFHSAPPPSPPSTGIPSAPPGSGGDQWAYQMVERMAFTAITEQRRARRWGIFFKILTFVYLGWLLVLISVQGDWAALSAGGETGKHTAVVDVHGVIAADSDANANTIIASVRDAFEDPATAGIILDIDSPGGSAVQSNQVYRELRRLREQYPDIPLYAVVGDLCASGGYYIASAADAIYVNEASLVGSIGVIMGGFGFVEAMEKLGVERRLLTAGENKALLDPFSPQNPDEVAHFHQVLAEIHQQFITAVKEGRGDRLATETNLFSGLIWSGTEAITLGLADELGGVDFVAREVIQAEDLMDFTMKPDYWERFAERMGASLLGQLAPEARVEYRYAPPMH